MQKCVSSNGKSKYSISLIYVICSLAWFGPWLAEKPSATPVSPVSHFASGGGCQGSTEVFKQIPSNPKHSGLNGSDGKALVRECVRAPTSVHPLSPFIGVEILSELSVDFRYSKRKHIVCIYETACS